MEQAARTERSGGLDLLRIVSMFMVTVLHLLGRGGVLENAVPFTADYEWAWLLETACYCAVDCYALLSGYFLCTSRCRTPRLVSLWLGVFFWSAGLTALFALREPVSPARFAQACLPVTFSQYWYFTAYFAVYCCAPFFNRLLAALDARALRRLNRTLFVLLSLLPTAFGQDPFVTGKGYSFLWLAALYFLGAALRRDPPRTRRSRVWLGGWAACVGTVFLSRLAIETIQFARTGAVGSGGWLLSYTSPLILAAAVCLLLWGRELRCGSGGERLIRFFAPAAFGVYLIHAQPFVFHRLLAGAAVPLLTLPAWGFPLAVFGIAAAVFLLCALLETARLALFRVLRAERLAEALGDRIDRLLSAPEKN